MARLPHCLIALASLWLAPAASSATTLDRAAWQSDYAFLKSALERADPNITWLGSPQGGVDLPSLERRTQAGLSASEGDADARQVLLAFVAGVHDGHFAELPYQQVAAATTPAPPAAVLDPTDPVGGCAALGYALVQRTSFSSPFETLPGFHLEADGVREDFRAGVIVMPNQLKLGLVRISWFRPTGFPSACERAWAKLRATGKSVTDDAIDDEIGPLLFGELVGQLKRFKAEGVDAVIVDVGSNNGGNDSGDWVARFFTTRPMHSARLRMTDALLSAPYFDGQIATLEAAAKRATAADADAYVKPALARFEASRAALGQSTCDLSWVWRERRAWGAGGCDRTVDAGSAGGPLDYLPAQAIQDPSLASALHWPTAVRDYWGAWSGPTYVVTDKKSYSSAEMFAAVISDNGAAKTVGDKTGGDGCGFMTAATPVILPHSHLRFRIPNCLRLRADGTNEVAGISPDLPVPALEGESDRAHALRILDAVSSDLRR